MRIEDRFCLCGSRYQVFYYDDGHQERSKPIHCDLCHLKTYNNVWYVCGPCESILKGAFMEERLPVRPDGFPGSNMPTTKSKRTKRTK